MEPLGGGGAFKTVVKKCLHLVFRIIKFDGNYYNPTQYVAKCLYCRKLGKYSLTIDRATASLIK